MKITKLTPTAGDVGSAFRLVAVFDIDLSQHVRVNGMRLIQAADGRHLVYGPNGGGKRCITFSKEAASQVTELALQTIKDRKSNGTFKSKDA